MKKIALSILCLSIVLSVFSQIVTPSNKILWSGIPNEITLSYEGWSPAELSVTGDNGISIEKVDDSTYLLLQENNTVTGVVTVRGIRGGQEVVLEEFEYFFSTIPDPHWTFAGYRSDGIVHAISLAEIENSADPRLSLGAFDAFLNPLAMDLISFDLHIERLADSSHVFTWFRKVPCLVGVYDEYGEVVDCLEEVDASDGWYGDTGKKEVKNVLLQLTKGDSFTFKSPVFLLPDGMERASPSELLFVVD